MRIAESGNSDFALRNQDLTVFVVILARRSPDWFTFRMKKELETRTKQFALEVINFVTTLTKSKVSDVLGYQMLKSGTSIGANYREANRASSRDDFIHKISICEKEAAETEYWLELVLESGIASASKCKSLFEEVRELLAIFVSSGRTAKSNR